ncbi:MAG: dicarboxylate/amino acid:cation symporter, partial [Bacteroidetes bacterium]|nr:dicarboxylate/amino acid:cation symporter [Bacteroidota bacterium]
MKKPALHWQVIIALILGLIYSFLAVQNGWNEFTLSYIDPFGRIFINVLKLIAVPLVLFSIISGIVNLKDVRKLGRIGVRTLLIYLATTVTAVSVGLVLVNLIQPGSGIDPETRIEKRMEYELWLSQNPSVKRLDSLHFLTDPQYASEATEAQERLAMDPINTSVQDKLEKARANKQKGPLQPLVDVFPENIFGALADMQMLQIIFFSVFFGIVLILLPASESKPMIDLVNSAN